MTALLLNICIVDYPAWRKLILDGGYSDEKGHPLYILDKYANGGRGFTRQSRADVSDKEFAAAAKTALAALTDAKTIARRDAANATASRRRPSAG